MRRIVGVLLGAAAIAFLALALVKTYDRLPRETLDIRPLFAVAAVVVGAAAYVLNGLVWRFLMQRPGMHLSASQAIRIVSLSQIAKYVPGGIWQPVSWIAMTSSLGISASAAGVTLLALMALDVASALIVGPLLLALNDATSGFTWLLLVVPVSVAVVHPRVLSKFVRLAQRLIRRLNTGDVSLVPAPRLYAALVGKLPVWLLLGVANLLAARAMHISGPGDWLLLTGGYAVAWAVGFLALPVPSGLGIREAVFIFILRTSFPIATAVLLAVSLRLLYIVVEGLVALCALPIGRTGARSAEVSTPAQ